MIGKARIRTGLITNAGSGSPMQSVAKINNLVPFYIMTSEKIAMGINLRQNKIVGSSAYGKYYPEVDQQKTLSLR